MILERISKQLMTIESIQLEIPDNGAEIRRLIEEGQGLREDVRRKGTLRGHFDIAPKVAELPGPDNRRVEIRTEWKEVPPGRLGRGPAVHVGIDGRPEGRAAQP